MPAVALLLAVSPKPDRARVRFQTKRDTPGPPGWVLGIELTSQSHKTQHCEENSTLKYTTGWDT